jgi:hypothetical protein
MRSWFFFTSQDEVDVAALDLLERHGADALDEAVRLADVGRRIGSHRNGEIFHRVAQRLAVECIPVSAKASAQRAWLAKLKESVAEFGAPRVAADDTTPSTWMRTRRLESMRI